MALYTQPSCAQRERQNFVRYKSLIATPGNLGTGVTLPADGYFYLSYSAVLASATVLVTANTTRDIGAPAEAANTQSPIGKLSRGVVVKKKTGVVGTVKLYVRDGLGRRFLIAQG